MKLTIVGAGSTYTPELVAGLMMRSAELALTEVALHDVNVERLAPVAGFCRRMCASMGSAPQLSYSTDLERCLGGARFVVIQIRVGGQQGRHEDICLGLELGLIGQETTGVGGFAKALRTIPEVLKLAERIRRCCPEAWILNFTNPSGMVTEALTRRGIERVVGLCNVPIEMHIEIAKALGRSVSEVTLDWVGLNHLGWVRRVLVDGRDVLPKLLDDIEAQIEGPANLPELRYPPGFLRALGALPSSYVRFFYAEPEMRAQLEGKSRSRAQEVMALEAQLFEAYGDDAVRTLPSVLSERGGAWYSRLAVEVVGALLRDTPSVHIVNTTNGSAIEGLWSDAVVEVPCELSASGVVPLDCGTVDPTLFGLMVSVKAYERHGIDAALSSDRQAAFKALISHPLVPDASTAHRVIERLILRGLI